MPFQWYALHVKPHKEQSVDDLLRSREMEVFYPPLKVKPVNPRARKIRPFFPGYMFVYLDLEEAGKNYQRVLQEYPESVLRGEVLQRNEAVEYRLEI